MENYKSPETEKKPQFDSVLVHIYWASKGSPRNPEEIRGALRTRLSARAGALMYKEGIVDKLVLLIGKNRGPDYPAFSEVVKNELVEKYKIPEEAILALPIATDTQGEDTEFLRLSKENNWKNVATLGFKTHAKSRERFLPPGENNGVNVTHLTVEGILGKDNLHVANLVKRLTSSKYEMGFKLYEQAKDVLFRTPFGIVLLSKAANSRKSGESKIQDLTQHSLDVFKS